MATRALYIVTIMKALVTLEEKLGIERWNSRNTEEQLQLFELLADYRQELAKVTGLEALASTSYQELNDFLTSRKFEPMFDPFDPTMGVGVVSVLDRLVRWLNGPGLKVEIGTEKGDLPGFELPGSGVNVYRVSDYPGSYLLELLTKSDDTLWLMTHPDNGISGLALAQLSIRTMKSPRRLATAAGIGLPYVGAKVPMVDFDIKPDISWLMGAGTTTRSGVYYYVAKACQQFKMRMDETGARVKVATGILMMRGLSREPIPFVLNRPFYGWWTQKGLETLPMAAFYADWDAFRQPTGSLEDL